MFQRNHLIKLDPVVFRLIKDTDFPSYAHFGKFFLMKGEGKFHVSDTYCNLETSATMFEDHRMTNYLKNLIEVLENENQSVKVPDENFVENLKELFIPVEELKKRGHDKSCIHKNEHKTCNQYSIKFSKKEKDIEIIFRLCCQNAEYLYNAFLIFEKNQKILAKETKKFGRNSIELAFMIPTDHIFTKEWSLFNNTKTEKQKCFEIVLELISHFEQPHLTIEFSDKDFQ